MNTGLIPVRYATALLDFAGAGEQQKQVYFETKTLAAHFAQFAKLRTALDNPVLSATDKRKLIVTAAGNKVSAAFERFLDLVLQNNREAHLQEIALKYIDLYRRKNNIYYGKLTTATVVNDDTEKKLMTLVESTTGGTIEMEKVVDPGIIGGFLFEVDFVRWDASVSGQLRRIRNEYIEKNKKTI